MMDETRRNDLVRRLTAAQRAVELYSPSHQLVHRALQALTASMAEALKSSARVVIGFIGDDVVVDAVRLSRGSASVGGFARDMRERGIEKITIARGVTSEEVRLCLGVLGDRRSTGLVADRLQAAGIRHLTVGAIAVDEPSGEPAGITAARRVYGQAVETAETLWQAAKAGDRPDPAAARSIIDSLARLVTEDRTSLMALTALKQYDNYTFTHMVNVSALSMAQARALDIRGPMLREFGLAALMHDIGKVHTPSEILNKPDALTKAEFAVMKRHVVDGAHILRRTPEMPALAPIVAFEHHLKQDLSGYPEGVGPRTLNLCTMIVSIADVFDALRSNRPYRQGLATERIRAIMSEQGNPAFNQVLLKRFVNLMGLFPVGSLVRLNTDDVAVVTAEHPGDPFRPQVKVIADGSGTLLPEPLLANTWERDDRGAFPFAAVEALDPATVGIEPLQYL